MPANVEPNIRVGIGGWTFEPWRGTFYPEALPHRLELEYASQHLTSVEINGTYYGSQKPESFVRWHEETPADFVFSVKGPRFTTNRRVLAEAGSSIERFFASGVMELKEKLGPINWQFLPTKRFDPADFEAFLKQLPRMSRDAPSGTSSKSVMKASLCRSSLNLFAHTRLPWPSRTRRASRRSPMSPRPSSMSACNARQRACRPAIRRRRSMRGRTGARLACHAR